MILSKKSKESIREKLKNKNVNISDDVIEEIYALIMNDEANIRTNSQNSLQPQNKNEKLGDKSNSLNTYGVIDQILAEASSLEKDEFFQIVQNDLNSAIFIREFLISKKEKIWQDIRNILLVERNQRYCINNDKFIDLRGEIKESFATGKTILDDLSEHGSGSDPSYHNSRRSSMTAESEDTPSSQIAIKTSKASTRANYPIQDKPIRGDVVTYAKEIMGNFKYILPSQSLSLDNNLYIDESSTLRRPTSVTSNLGSIAGDHVIPFAFFTKYIESLVKGEEVYTAIETLILEVGYFYDPTDIQNHQDRYQAIIDIAKLYQRSNDFRNKIEAAEFLRSTFIPYIIAIWNQQDLAAFISSKTNVDRGVEGNVVKTGIKHQTINSRDDAIEHFIKMVDYKPVDSLGDIDPDSIQNLLNRGKRTNDLKTLSYVFGKILETCNSIYRINDFEIKMILQNLLEQNGWLEYYHKHPKDLSSAVSKKLSKKVTPELFCDIVISHIEDSIKKLYPFMYADDEASPQDAGNVKISDTSNANSGLKCNMN